ncbi:hypothetical protein CGSMWGv1400E_06963 [Gardnerella vaginalis 1400E]|uniref:Uncharacterized protein n=1 Tax=Gardnerella vaginalis 1400E TaxID=698956 RepID=I4LSV3_GARVA|nr:hypothetical protein CGSMWGv1400E_06963 [Gardnerella vaginalis 1400E]
MLLLLFTKWADMETNAGKKKQTRARRPAFELKA